MRVEAAMFGSWALETANRYLADVALYTFFFALGSLFTSWNVRAYYQMNDNIAQALGMFGAGGGGRGGAGAGVGEGSATVISVRAGGGFTGLDLRVSDLERTVLTVRSSAMRDAACMGGMGLVGGMGLGTTMLACGMSGIFGPARSGKIEWLHQLAIRCQLQHSQGGLDASRVVVLDPLGHFELSRVAASAAAKFELDAGSVISRITVVRTFCAARLASLLSKPRQGTTKCLLIHGFTAAGFALTSAGETTNPAPTPPAPAAGAAARTALLKALDTMLAPSPCAVVFTEDLENAGTGSHGRHSHSSRDPDSDHEHDRNLVRSGELPHSLAASCANTILLSRLPRTYCAPPTPDARLNDVFAARLVSEQHAMVDRRRLTDDECLYMQTRWGLTDVAEVLSPTHPAQAAHRKILADFLHRDTLSKQTGVSRHVALLQCAFELGATRRWTAHQAQQRSFSAIPVQLGTLQGQVQLLQASVAQLGQLAPDAQVAGTADTKVLLRPIGRPPPQAPSPPLPALS